MKLAFLGDRHIDSRSERFRYALQQWDTAIQTAIDLGAEAFVCLGDVCEGDPDGPERLALAERYERMLAVGPVYEVLGNHEAYSALGFLKYMGVQVAWNDFLLTEVPDSCVLLLVPYPRRGRAPFQNLGGDTIEGSMVAAAVRIAKHVQDARAIADAKHLPLIVGGHFTIESMRVSSSDFEIHVGREVIVPIAALQKADLTVTAHIHRAQHVTPRIVGVGSLYHCSFAEADEKKGILLVEAHGQEGITHTAVELMGRDHLDIRLTGAEFKLQHAHVQMRVTARTEIKLTLELEPGDPFNYEPLLQPIRDLAAYCVVKKERKQVLRPVRAPEIAAATDVREQFKVWLDVTHQPSSDGIYQKLEEITAS